MCCQLLFLLWVSMCACGFERVFCVFFYKYSNMVLRIPREFAGLEGKCLACHPECKPQTGRVSCTGPVIVIANQTIYKRNVSEMHKCWILRYFDSHASFILHFPALPSGVGRRRVLGMRQLPRWSLLYVVLSHWGKRWPEGPDLQISQQRGSL